VNYAYDAFMNVTQVSTKLENPTNLEYPTPLVSLAYTYTNPDSRRIASVTATDIQGDSKNRQLCSMSQEAHRPLR